MQPHSPARPCPALSPPLSSCTSTQADILEHRQEQIKAEETKLRTMQQNMEKLDAELAKAAEEMRLLREQNAQQSQRLEDAATLLQVGARARMCVTVCVRVWLCARACA